MYLKKDKEEQKMKTQKLFVIAAIVCLFVGASGAAMAETLYDCGDGSINGGTYEAIVLTEWEDCVLVGVTVTPGGVRVRNPRLFSLINSYVKNGNVRVRRDNKRLEPSTASILNNVVENGNIVIQELDEADVRRNTVVNGTIRVIDSPSQPDQYAEVIQNKIKNGNLRVNDNLGATVKENTTIGGNITCRGNLLLIAPCNEAVQGTVRCSRDLFPGE
jgi:hypothetical protein